VLKHNTIKGKGVTSEGGLCGGRNSWTAEDLRWGALRLMKRLTAVHQQSSSKQNDDKQYANGCEMNSNETV